MTCAGARERFSDLVDDLLAAEDRAALAAHLAGCAGCRRELDRLQATVSALRAAEPPRAPAGFVDRVLAAARPAPWYRRAVRRLLFPLPVKLPLEAAAIVLVGIGVAYVFERTPEFQDATRIETFRRESEPPRGAKLRAPERAEAPREPAPPAARSPESTAPSAPGPPVTPAPSAAPRVEAPVGAPEARTSDATAPQQVLAAPETPRDAPAGPRAAQAPARVIPPAAEKESARAAPPARAAVTPEEKTVASPQDSASARARSDAARPAAPLPVAPRAEAPAPQSGTTTAESVAPPIGLPPSAPTASTTPRSQLRLAAKAAPPAVSGRLAVENRVESERALRDLVSRHRGTLLSRRAEPDAVTVEILLPRDAYPGFVRAIAALGRLTLEREPAELPESLRLDLRLD